MQARLVSAGNDHPCARPAVRRGMRAPGAPRAPARCAGGAPARADGAGAARARRGAPQPPARPAAPRAAARPPPPAPADADAAPADAGAWRVFGVSVPYKRDAGKDDTSVTAPLLDALRRKLGVSALDAAAVAVVRKSFDARTRRGRGGGSGGAEPSFSYVLDVADDALAAARRRRGGAPSPPLAPVPGQLERAPRPPPPLVRPVRDAGAAAAAPLGPPPAPLAERVYVVGGGPSGLFAALRLAEAGLPVTLLERGQPVEQRGRDIGALFARGILAPDSNLCFGEGGAGTWSDGKLTTRIGRNSAPVRSVLAALVHFGAPDSILVDGKPHLGTDRLVRLLRALRARLAALGAAVRWGARVERVELRGGAVAALHLADGTSLPARHVILAVGHSARPLYAALLREGVAITPQACAVGFRVEHPQSLVNAAQYGAALAAEVARGAGRLPVADYRLVARPAEADAQAGLRPAYSFCMCPGGQIVPTSTDPAELCVNGMSFSRRASPWANSGLVVPIGPEDYAPFAAPGREALAGVHFQAAMERAAAVAGGGSLVAPAQRVPDFLAGATSATLQASSYRLGVRSAPLHELYPPAVTAALRAALLRFDARLPGYASEHGLLHGVETRTSAPLRIERGADYQSPSAEGLYPVGEGAGYAGGIVSAAVDGLGAADALIAQLMGVAPAQGMQQQGGGAGGWDDY
jgi:uncharacterized FAD-dependent dehydrogenase